MSRAYQDTPTHPRQLSPDTSAKTRKNPAISLSGLESVVKGLQQYCPNRDNRDPFFETQSTAHHSPPNALEDTKKQQQQQQQQRGYQQMVTRTLSAPQPPPRRQQQGGALSCEMPIAGHSLLRNDAQNQQHQHQNEEEEQQHQNISANVATAALVARGALKSGYLWKMGSNVPRWKRRYFVLKPITMLFYYMSEHDTEPRGCIDLDLFDAVRRVGLTQTEDGGAVGRSRGGDSEVGAPRRTAFELYRSGSPEGSGFMLEARGHEDWEHWVETIANGRHGKMQAETDVLKGANKLLLEEIRGLEQQVAMFRGYADQRHVTVLALRDERQRNRDLCSEIHALGETACALSHHIKGNCKDVDYSDNEGASPRSAETTLARGDAYEAQDLGARGTRLLSQTHTARVGATDDRDTSFLTLLSTPDSVPMTLASATASFGGSLAAAAMVGGVRDGFENKTHCDETETVSTAASCSKGDNEHGTLSTTSHEDNSETAAGSTSEQEEVASLEALRQALADARAELDRRGNQLRQEEKARRAVERRAQQAEDAAQAAGERARVSEAVTARARGRVSVLERNVEYLQWQQQRLRAELCQSQQRIQRARAQRAVLKKEVREMWSAATTKTGEATAPTVAASSSPSACGYSPSRFHRPNHGPIGAGVSSVAPSKMPRSRTMGDLMQVAEERDVDTATTATFQCQGRLPQATRPRARPGTTGMVSVVGGAGAGGEVGEGVLAAGGLRSCLSRASLGGASDGGDTDMAEQTCSEISDEECLVEDVAEGGLRRVAKGVSGVAALSSHDRPNSFRAEIRRTIRRRAGQGEVASLPPPRHERILQAAKRLPSNLKTTAQPTATPRVSSEGVGGGLVASALSMSTPSPETCSAGGGATGGGLSVAGLLLSGIGKGMVEKATQGMMGKKLGLWPGAGGGPGFLSGSGGNFGGQTATQAWQQSQQLDGPSSLPSAARPRSTTSLPDYAQLAARWGLATGTGSTAAGAASGVSVHARESSVSLPLTGQVAPATGGGVAPGWQVAEADAAGAGVVVPPCGSMSTAVSRTALIQLSDLELAEPCGNRAYTMFGNSTVHPGDSCGNRLASRSEDNVDTAAAAGERAWGNAGAGDGKGIGDERRYTIDGSTITKQLWRQMQQRQQHVHHPPKCLEGERYELVFNSQKIGLRFCSYPDETAVIVAGLDGYTGPSRSAFVGGEQQRERLRPDIGDVLESYNGCSTAGKALAVVARELAACDRPLTLGFRSSVVATANKPPAGRAVSESESEAESDETEWSFGGKFGGGHQSCWGEGLGLFDGLDGASADSRESGGGPNGRGISCAAAQGGMVFDGRSLWRDAVAIAPQRARS